MFGLIIGLTGLGLVTIGILALAMFPEARVGIGSALMRGYGRLMNRSHRTLKQAAVAIRRHVHPASSGIREAAAQLGQHRWLAVMLAIVLIVPAALVLGLRQHVALQGYDPTVRVDPGTERLISSLLRGEQLVPPPPLPPAAFVTREVEQVRPHLDLGRADRRWASLDPDFRQHLLVVFSIMREQYGYEMVLLEGYRSPQRQAELVAAGVNVTHAAPGRSYHQYGLAADCAFYRDGHLVIADDTAWAQRGYALYGEVAAAAGLAWGGSWKSLRDLGHVELRAPGRGPPDRG